MDIQRRPVFYPIPIVIYLLIYLLFIYLFIYLCFLNSSHIYKSDSRIMLLQQVSHSISSTKVLPLESCIFSFTVARKRHQTGHWAHPMPLKLYSSRSTIRSFSSKHAKCVSPTETEISLFKTRLLGSEWRIYNDVISTYPAKQLHVTTQSLLDKSCPPFMEGLNRNTGNKVMNLNELYRVGSPLPLGYSLAYGNPLSNETELSMDGYDNYHAPVLNGVEYFKRRMWVSGSFTYRKENPLRFGDILDFSETVSRIKVFSNGGMIFADYKRSFDNKNGNSIIENRGLCYLKDIYKETLHTGRKSSTVPDKSITIVPSIISNFRMSAMTFNSHQIHYNPLYAKNVEKYTDVVVEAPLLVALSLQFWQNNNPNVAVSAFKYKIITPSFINQPLTINYKSGSDVVKLWITNSESTICFESTIQI